ncbi:MAG: cyclase family protein [Dissulfurispiraceae bacterium]
MVKYRTIYDISVLLGERSIDYPGDTKFSAELMVSLRSSGMFDLTKLVMSAHSGTHIDTPSHFIADSKNIDNYTIKDFILPAHVVEIQDEEAVRVRELLTLDLNPGEALLFKTNNSRSTFHRDGTFTEHFVYLAPDAADFCIEKKVKLVGIDYITIDKYGDDTFPIHHKLFEKDILILEGINLQGIPLGRYTLFCLPLKMKCEASPVRAILIQ